MRKQIKPRETDLACLRALREATTSAQEGDLQTAAAFAEFAARMAEAEDDRALIPDAVRTIPAR